MPPTEEPQAAQHIEVPAKWSVCTIRRLNANRDFGVALALQFGAQTASPKPGTYHISGISDTSGFADFLRDCKTKQPDVEIIFDEIDWQVLKRVCKNVLSRLKRTLRSRA